MNQGQAVTELHVFRTHHVRKLDDCFVLFEIIFLVVAGLSIHWIQAAEAIHSSSQSARSHESTGPGSSCLGTIAQSVVSIPYPNFAMY